MVKSFNKQLLYTITGFILALVITSFFINNIVGVFAIIPLTPPTTPPTTPPVVTTTPTITLTPKPKDNKLPKILPESEHLPKGKKNRFYWTTIKITDPNHDKVFVKITGLPKNLNKTCVPFINGSRCYIMGTPKQAGTFEVTVKAWDSETTYSQKIYKLNIK